MKTAISHYSLGKHAEADANSFDKNARYHKGRFTCPECGEDVFLTSGKYSNFFSHYQKTKSSSECDRRVDGNSSLTIYERLGLPLYLRINNTNKYYLSIGFKALPSSIIQIAQKNKVFMEISDNSRKNSFKSKYFVNEERFHTDTTTYIPIDFVPSDEYRYCVTFSNDTIGNSLKKVWSDYADGFSADGALFTVNKNGGKKVRHGDAVAINTDYYWVKKNKFFSSDISGMKIKACGKLALKNEVYFVSKVRFVASLSNESEYRKLADYLKMSLKVFLVDKQPEVIPLWPPSIKTGDGYEIPENSGNMFCNVISSNDRPKVFAYKDTNILPTELSLEESNDESNMISFRITSSPVLINVDRKLVSNGTSFRYKEMELSELDSEIVEVKNQENIDVCLLHHVREEKGLKFRTISKAELIRVNNGKINKSEVKTGYIEIENIKNHEKIFIVSHNRVVYSVDILRKNRSVLENYNDKRLYDFLKIHNKDAKIVMSMHTRKRVCEIINSYNYSKKYLCNYLKKNTIPITIDYLLGGEKNVR